MSELKPCPFCGSTRVIVDTTVPGSYAPECLDCCTIISFCYPTKEDAIQAWNRRADDDKLRKNLLKIIEAMRFIPLDEDEQGPKGILLRVVAELWPEEEGDSDV